MAYRITVLPENRHIDVAPGADLLTVLRQAGFLQDAPCGGNGTCGKCRVLADGQSVLACRTPVSRDMTVSLPHAGAERILTKGIPARIHADPAGSGYPLAFDIGTTTVVGYLLDGATGQVLATEARGNPQAVYGADVISRIRHAVNGSQEALTGLIRQCLDSITRVLCEKAGVCPGDIHMISVVGNPAMQQLFLGICPENLIRIPFAPVLTDAEIVSAKEYLPVCESARLMIVPDISGYVGADTAACVLATQMDTQEPVTLLVDIGTNGEMVLGSRERMCACSTAAGPALEGANIRHGMRARDGAIDHVGLENGQFRCSVIGGTEARGICGSGLIDAVAAALDAGLLDSRGRILTGDRCIRLTEQVFLTQEDIREVQLAKGAIAAGIDLMAAHLGITLADIERVYLAGAFGTFMNPAAACRIGLLPAELKDRITAVGNAAGSGAGILACDPTELDRVQKVTEQIEFIELAAVPEFRRCFAKNMRF